jgi:hypothetical protein
MSTDSHSSVHANNGPVHDDVSFEGRDVSPRTIILYLFYLAVTVVASLFICQYVLKVTTAMAERGDTPPPASRAVLGPDYTAYPPEPRMQGVPGHENDPQQDLREKIAEDNAANQETGWEDQKAGVARIPVQDAMKIIAQKGLGAAEADKKP